MARYEAEAYEMESTRIAKKISDFWDVTERQFYTELNAAVTERNNAGMHDGWWLAICLTVIVAAPTILYFAGAFS